MSRPALLHYIPYLPLLHLTLCYTIRNGQWSVGADGVEDGIEKWKEADTSTHAEKYRLGACFDE